MILQKKEFFARIFQDNVRSMISEAVAEVQKDFFKSYFLSNRVYFFCESFEILLAFWILLDKMNAFLSFFYRLSLMQMFTIVQEK